MSNIYGGTLVFRGSLWPIAQMYEDKGQSRYFEEAHRASCYNTSTTSFQSWAKFFAVSNQVSAAFISLVICFVFDIDPFFFALSLRYQTLGKNSRHVPTPCAESPFRMPITRLFRGNICSTGFKKNRSLVYFCSSQPYAIALLNFRPRAQALA